MKKGDIVALNAIFSQKVKLPAMSGAQLYEVLSAKADLSAEAEAIEAKAEKFRLDTKPAEVDEYNAKMSDPSVRDWWNSYVSMRSRLFEEPFDGKLPAPCIPRDLFPEMIVGLTTGEAELVFKYLVKSE